MISRLINNSGDVRALLGAPHDAAVPLDISAGDWDATAILNGLLFRNIVLQDRRVNVNFVNCTFESTTFRNIEAGEAHLWGARNKWTDCEFDNVVLPTSICPYNSFSYCKFKSLKLIGASAYKTQFESCEFYNLYLESLRVSPDRFENQPLADISKIEPNVKFKSCRFVAPKFYKCTFSNVLFQACTVEKPEISFCNFDDAVCIPKPWWEPYESRDPFVAFLYELLALIERKLGKSGKAYTNLASYKDEYLSGKITNKDYSACLYQTDVPNSEIDAIENDMLKLSRKFRF